MRCILHIGTEKTATTLIQNWLYENYDSLSSQGVALTKVSGHSNNRKLVSYFQNIIDEYMRGSNVHSQKEKNRFFKSYEKEFSDEISALKRDHTTCFLTSEHFHSRLKSRKEIKNLKKFLDRFFDEYRIICYFREQSKVRTSLYSTGLQVNNGQSILDFQKGASPKDHYYNYLSFFSKWEDVFGKEALKPRIFSKDFLLQGDIRKDLLANALPEIDASRLDFKTVSANESLSADEAVLFRTINSTRSDFSGKFPDPTPRVAKNVVRDLDFLDFSTDIVDPRQDAMYNEFTDSNIKFFSRYFGEEKNLFARPVIVDSGQENRKVFRISDVAQLLKGLLSVESIVSIQPNEIDFLRDLAIRLHSEGVISAPESITLLKLASRARPNGPAILAKIDELRNET